MEKTDAQTREVGQPPMEPDYRPVIDISYVELPEKVTHRINLSSILGTVAFLAALSAPGAIEGERYVTALVLVVVFGVCAGLSGKEDRKKK